MPTLQASLLAAALALPGAGQDAPDRSRWLARVTSAIASAGARATCTGPWASADATVCAPIWDGTAGELDAALLVTAWFESRLLVRIAANRCRPEECDPIQIPGRGTVHLARSNWQLQASGPVSRADWWAAGGTRAVELQDAAWTAARVVALHRRRCAPHTSRWIAPTISGYATGYSCRWGGAANRARMVERVIAAIRGAT